MRETDDRGRRDGWALVADYEEVRSMVVGSGALTAPVKGMALLRRRGMAAWMQAAGGVATGSCGRRERQPVWQTQRPAAELVTLLAQVAMAASVQPARMEETRR